MPTDFFLILLLVASLAAYVFLWIKLRQVEKRIETTGKRFEEVERVVQTEIVPGLGESSKRVATVLDRLDAERTTAEAELARSREGLAPMVGELRKASEQLVELRTELARIMERVGTKSVEDNGRVTGEAWLKDLARNHLLSLGIGAISIDGVVARPDGSSVVRARGTRGNELWTGSVVVRGGKVESASSLAARMFP
jgi:hypothetical protein